ncbi:hypothetical protein SeMB42_g02666 [Synchytrium endobioticum]|uniref:Small RNA 2'-O-methyltransferase n=1 Tax=Synchytrium endobioticum TaxID=286115 RepID=A0A507DA03_9FUNG|nr:hypothetical protein SeLEV6574_g02121 [Synchytrium endobioticum]TPX49264.1 hypothetical protein SeMB42_g02666 [Synchytrium endobioticum]
MPPVHVGVDAALSEHPSNAPAHAKSDHEPSFRPPLWRQRRAAVLHKLRDHHVQSVLDLGCGEGALLSILLNDTSFTHVAGVDLNKDVLQMARIDCSPTDADYCFLRETPVRLDLYQGSVADADSRLAAFDAVASVEVIEHLDPPVLEAFPHTVLGVYHPRLVIITTPNAEFNVNFKSLKYGTPTATLRNDDHRFEWTRQEFQSWCNRIASTYGYTVEYSGIGLLTPEETTVGYCTQMATFVRLNAQPLPIPADDPTTPYTLITSIDFPYFEQDGFTNSDILTEMAERTRYILYMEALATFASNISPHNKLPPPPYLLHIDRYWNVLRIRQICKRRKRLVEVVESVEAKQYFEYDNQSEILTIIFDPLKYDTSMDEQGSCDDVHDDVYGPQENSDTCEDWDNDFGDCSCEFQNDTDSQFANGWVSPPQDHDTPWATSDHDARVTTGWTLDTADEWKPSGESSSASRVDTSSGWE